MHSKRPFRRIRLGKLGTWVVKTGWADTTQCYGTSPDVHCTGGIHDEYATLRYLTLNDGTTVVIHHAAMRPDPVKTMQDGSQVLYRVHWHMGVKDILVYDPNNPNKEGWYYTMKESSP